jgi:hypothetical protein
LGKAPRVTWEFGLVSNAAQSLGAMWVRRTEAEIAEEQRRKRRGRLVSAALFGVFITALTTFFFGWRESAQRGRFVIPFDEIRPRFLFCGAFGVVAAFLFYKWETRRRPMMICPQCEATKYMDDVSECSCGGRFEKVDVMKYVA